MAYEVNVFYICDECGKQSGGIEPYLGLPHSIGGGAHYLTSETSLLVLASRNGFTIDDDCAFCDDCAPKKGL